MKLKLAPLPDSAFYKATLKDGEEGRQAELTIVARGPQQEGPRNEFIKLETGLKDEPELQVPVTLTVPPALVVTPVAFAPMNSPEAPDQRTLLVEYHRSGDFEIKSVTPTDPKVKVEIKPRTPNRSYNLLVTFPAGYEAEPGTTVTLLIETTAAEQPTVVTTLQPRVFAKPTTQPG